jgi:hypothetical protein
VQDVARDRLVGDHEDPGRDAAVAAGHVGPFRSVGTTRKAAAAKTGLSRS